MTRRASLLLLSAASLLLATALLLLLPLREPLELTRIPVPTGQDSVTLPAAIRYRAGRIHRWLQGDGYRALWTEPIRVPVLDLARYDGGLIPLREGGGMETRSLQFRSRYGRRLTFRSLDKEVVRLLQHGLRRSLLAWSVQDHGSAAHPGAPLVAALLQAAVGLPTPNPQLVLLPDTPALGPFRGRFAGLLGMLQESAEEVARAMPGVDPRLPVLDSDALFAELDRAGGDRLDTHGFLTARLLDLVLNDWDRHKNQWRWAGRREPGGIRWLPIPLDRDQALARYDGLLLGIARLRSTRLSVFGPEYPDLSGLTRNNAEFTRRVLRGLPRREWDSVAGWVQVRLSDAVIDSAVRRLPEPWWKLSGSALAAALKQRRNGLPAEAAKFYDQVAGRR